MAIAMDEYSMSQLGALRWSAVTQRIRAFSGDAAVVDSRRARLVSEPRRIVGTYAVPVEDIRAALVDNERVEPDAQLPPVLTPGNPFGMHSSAGTSWTIDAARPLVGAAFCPDDPDVAGYALLEWNAFDRWVEEDQEVFVHPHDPFHRIDVLSCDQHVTVALDGTVVADTHRPSLLLETHLPPRYYMPREDVRMDLLEPSDTHTGCAYKGQASYWSVRLGDRVVPDAVWTYPQPLHDGEPVKDLLCFFDERFDITVDGVLRSRPQTQWS